MSASLDLTLAPFLNSNCALECFIHQAMEHDRSASIVYGEN